MPSIDWDLPVIITLMFDASFALLGFISIQGICQLMPQLCSPTLMTQINKASIQVSLIAGLTPGVPRLGWGDPRYEDTVLKVFVAKPQGSRWV